MFYSGRAGARSGRRRLAATNFSGINIVCKHARTTLRQRSKKKPKEFRRKQRGTKIKFKPMLICDIFSVTRFMVEERQLLSSSHLCDKKMVKYTFCLVVPSSVEVFFSKIIFTSKQKPSQKPFLIFRLRQAVTAASSPSPGNSLLFMGDLARRVFYMSDDGLSICSERCRISISRGLHCYRNERERKGFFILNSGTMFYDYFSCIVLRRLKI